MAADDLLSAMFDHGIDIRKRRVFLQLPLSYDEEEHPNPGGSVVEQVVRGLLYLDKTQGEIELWVNTPGGSIYEMFAIYDTMRACDNDVTTVGFGQICSAGVLLLAGGSTRYVMPNAVFMSHQMSLQLEGNVHEVRAHLAHFEAWEERWAVAMGNCTKPKRTAKFWRAVHQDPKRSTYYLDARGMISHGVADEIWPPEEPE